LVVTSDPFAFSLPYTLIKKATFAKFLIIRTTHKMVTLVGMKVKNLSNSIPPFLVSMTISSLLSIYIQKYIKETIIKVMVTNISIKRIQIGLYGFLGLMLYGPPLFLIA